MQGTDSFLNQFYTQQPLLIDTLIYLVLFSGVAQVTLGRRYPVRGGRAIVAGVGMSLAIAASVSAYRVGFTLDQLAPISWLVLGSVLLILVASLLRMQTQRDGQEYEQGCRQSSHSTSHGHRFAFHLHTDRMPDPMKWGRRSSASTSEAPRSREAAESVNRTQATVSTLLEAFAEHVAMHGLDHQPESFLVAIARTQREVDRAYHHLLKHLARSGWRRDPGKQMLARDVESIIKQAAQHTALFHEAMRFAEAAIHGGNLRLIQESIEQMRQLERDSIRLTKLLEAIIERMQWEQPPAGTAYETRGDDAV